MGGFNDAFRDVFGRLAPDPKLAEATLRRVVRRARRMAERGVGPTDGLFGQIDQIQERVWLANVVIGSPWWTGLFGHPREACAVSYYVPNVIRFPPAAAVVRQLEGSKGV